MHPRFQHDCPVCTFLGTAITKTGDVADLHICVREKNSGYQSIIARYSSDGPDYESGPIHLILCHYPEDHVLRVAIQLAKNRGLI